MKSTQGDYLRVLDGVKHQNRDQKKQLNRQSQKLEKSGFGLMLTAVGGGVLLYAVPSIPFIVGAPIVAGTASLGALNYYQASRATEKAIHVDHNLAVLDALDASQMDDLARQLQGNETDLNEITKWADRVKKNAWTRGISI